MAGRGNCIHENGKQLYRKLTQPASGGVTGDPCLVGDRPGVLLTDQTADGYATVKFQGTFRLLVKAANAGGNTAVAVNDSLFYDAASTPKINKNASGVSFGWAASDETTPGALASGATGDIYVDLRG